MTTPAPVPRPVPSDEGERYPGLRAATRELHGRYFDAMRTSRAHWITSIGIGAGIIVVMTREEKPWQLRDLPSEVDGWPVVVKFSGPIIMGTGADE